MSQITDIQTGLYRIPNETALEDATQSFDVLELVTVELTTSTGGRGVGFTYTIGSGGAAIETFLESVCAPIVLDEPAVPREIRSTLTAETTFVGREGISELALSAVDIAAWDLLGRETGTPLYRLFGGDRQPVPAYETHGGWLHYDEETLVDNAERAAEDGFAGVKMKVGRGHAEDARRVTAVAEALPPDVDLMIDANCAYTVDEARRLASQLSNVDLAWLEEPLEKGDYAAYGDLRSHVDTPIATGENYYNPTQFKQVIEADGVDVVQPDVARVGGITPWIEVAELADAWGLSLSPHYIEPIHVHLATGYDNIPYIEHHSTVLDSVMDSPPTPDDGLLYPPESPGHGIEFEGLERYAAE
ncbi:mandelate racemase/muconate lactonizing enzyme family protein [Natronomonas sp. F2-12]|uniref:Mandelate racemase/muconate lactonizing enzyme family protein n=1 Tax=Natronomonas aquatica TaxID=2841590 RepID=A0A9R1CR61_9EURY|nr:mandelate racemase/muconate lactonizing enzyme family protein [Natronomonas aquatica]MCQ4333638.1 mandelate racemase/muconate lactonizing enzyme family protein [Natronomonas aquatica]